MVTSWILHSIIPELASSVIYADSAHVIWADLQNHFLQPNTTKVYRIKQDIAEWKQDRLSVSAYFTHLKSHRDELSSHISPPDCSWGASQKFLSSIQQDQAMKFLQGLHESFAPLRSQLLLQDPLPSVRKLYSLVLQEEKQREIQSSHLIKPEASALVTKNIGNFSPNSNHGEKGRPHCDHCDMDGHTVTTCYKIHGYTPKKNVMSPNHYNHCNRDSHTMTSCHKLHGFPPKKSGSNIQPKGFQVDGSQGLTAQPSLHPTNPSNTTDQYAQILAILQQGSSQPSVHLAGPVNKEHDWSGSCS
ncbi:UBN2_3 domain-containing protein [Cephalotus follicularis]|uniref:UBN2_3 domain-containing protein n=1 Tax=Cephalotus follicularis TaxID=3775 RepID=A0A1Q3BLS0_CEPFO|nr:UBN2_3 domain-containing protein [Cephalotus follicularis]